MKNFFKRFAFWVNWSRYLNCKKCCLNCKFYKDCIEEVKDLEDALDFHSFFD